MSKIVGYDQSESANATAIVCPECAEGMGSDELGDALVEGEEWGGIVPNCCKCGATITGLVSTARRVMKEESK